MWYYSVLVIGLPPGVFNVITSTNYESIGNTFMNSQEMRKVSFTGSVAVGKKLIKKSEKTVKRLSLELGGNAPFIVFHDASISLAVKHAIAAKFRNAGQACNAPNRFYIHEDIMERFVKKLLAKMDSIVVGNGFDEDTIMGPLNNRVQYNKVSGLVEDALSKGATLLYQGETDMAGLFYPPTVLSDIDSSMDLYHDEIFGPVIALQSFSSEAEMLQKANETNYGLAGYLFSREVSRCFRVAEKLEFGMVGVNSALISNAHAPFGGIKESGYGREGAMDGLDEYLQKKYICYGV